MAHPQASISSKGACQTFSYMFKGQSESADSAPGALTLGFRQRRIMARKACPPPFKVLGNRNREGWADSLGWGAGQPPWLGRMGHRPRQAANRRIYGIFFKVFKFFTDFKIPLYLYSALSLPRSKFVKGLSPLYLYSGLSYRLYAVLPAS